MIGLLRIAIRLPVLLTPPKDQLNESTWTIKVFRK